MEPTNENPEPQSPVGLPPELEKLLEMELPDLINALAGMFGGVQRDTGAHDAQMQLVGQHQRAAMVEADQEQNASESPEAEKLAWGLWRSECGCLHLAMPDGRGGWMVPGEETDFDPERLRPILSAMVEGLGEAGMRMLEALRTLPPE